MNSQILVFRKLKILTYYSAGYMVITWYHENTKDYQHPLCQMIKKSNYCITSTNNRQKIIPIVLTWTLL